MSGSTPADVLDLTVDPADALAIIGDATRVVRDDFAGPGGWSTGIADLLHAAGLVEVGLEWDAAACLTRVANGHTGTLRADVAAYPLTPFLGVTAGYIGSPPCQTFSMAGGGAGREHLEALCACVRGILLGRMTYEQAMAYLTEEGALDDKDGNPDPRNGLILIPARVIRGLLDHDGKGPTDLEWVALEQVPPAGPVFRVYAETLKELGFSAVCVVLNAANYGVPQTRERVFVIASRTRKITAPEPTHAKGGEPESLFGPGRLPWVAMASALGWAGGSVNQARGAGMVERHGERPARAVDTDPSLTVTGGASRRLKVTDAVRLSDVVLVNNVAMANQARRTLAEPAATITGGHDYSSRQFVPATPEAGRFLLDRRAGKPDAAGNYTAAPIVDVGVSPCPTLTGSAVGKGVWVVSDALLEERRAGSPKFDGHWAEARPATVVASREIVQHPGATKNRFNDSEKTRNDGLRITEAEGGILQGFPADYAWQGTSKGKRWEQIGNVVCPPVARRVVAEVLGVSAEPLPWHGYAFQRESASLEEAI